MAERTRARRGASGSSTRRRSAAAEEPTGRLNRDYGDEEYREPGEGYNGEEPTKGLYTCELVRITDHTSQDGNESVKWLFRLADGSENKHGDNVSGWMDSQYTTENTAWKEQQMLVALGVIKPGGKVNLTYDGIVKKAKQCTVRVGVERVIDDDGEGTWRGRMQAFLPLRESTGKSSTASKRRARDDEDAEDVFEDEPEGEDDEEETPPPRRSRSRRQAEPEPEPEEDEGDEEGGDEDWPEDPDELAAALEELSLTELKKVAKDDFGVTPKRGQKADAIIDAILDTLDEDGGDGGDEDEEDEPEEEPEPPKRTRRAASKGTSTGTRRKRGNQEPPF